MTFLLQKDDVTSAQNPNENLPARRRGRKSIADDKSVAKESLTYEAYYTKMTQDSELSKFKVSVSMFIF